MKILKNLILIPLLFPLWATGQETYNITLTSMVIKGTSNVHKWESKVNQLNGTTGALIEGEMIKGLTAAKMDIVVKSIKSSKGSIMDNKTYQALKSDGCPNISFHLVTSTLDATGSTLNSSGTLTVACVTKNIELNSTVKALGNGQFSISGSKKMKMTDFGIKPPTALLGAMQTGDEITIEYEIKLIK